MQIPQSHKDGVRICVMRRPCSEITWDIWMPVLAPSHELLDAYHAGIISWPVFDEKFHQEVIVAMQEYLQILVEISKYRTVTILCWEKIPESCHRKLLAQACKQLDPYLDVVIN